MPRWRFSCSNMGCPQLGEIVVGTCAQASDFRCPGCGRACDVLEPVDDQDALGSSADRKRERESCDTPPKARKKPKLYHQGAVDIVPRCEYNTRLEGSTAYLNMKQPNGRPNYYDSYGARSAKARHDTYKSYDATDLRIPQKKPMGFYAKAGTSENIFGFNPKYKRLLDPRQAKPVLHLERQNGRPEAFVYQNSLEYRVAACKYILEQVKSKNVGVVANADHDYPCVLVLTPGGPTRADVPEKKKLETARRLWTRFVMACFVGVANHIAWSEGWPIEITMRSSFGHLCPTIAECNLSYRINVGIIPKEYMDVLVATILEVHDTFDARFKTGLEALPFDKQSSFSQLADGYYLDILLRRIKNKLTPEELKEILAEKGGEEKVKRQYLGKNQKLPVKLGDTDDMWSWLWSAGDGSGKSVLYQIVEREQASLEGIADGVTKALFNQAAAPDSIQDLVTGFPKRFGSSKGGGISFDPLPMSPVKKFTDYHPEGARSTKDARFWKLIQLIMSSLGGGSDFEYFHSVGKVEGLYAHLERLNVWFIQNEAPSLLGCTDDGVGSDSEEEAELDGSRAKVRVYSKKLITPTGMRAIHLAHCCGKLFAAKQGIRFTNIKIDAKRMYYETAEALEMVETDIPNPNPTSNKPLEILFFDLNHCNCNQEQYAKIDFNKFDVVVLDHTSAIPRVINGYMTEAFEAPKVSLVLLVTSGLKNEQGGGDMNPYGCIRIVSRDKAERDRLYDELKKLERAYKYPKEGHAIRKAYKKMGFGLTTKSILSPGFGGSIFDVPPVKPTFEHQTPGGKITFELNDVDPDGNCLFAALDVAAGTNAGAQKVRADVCAQLEQRPELVPGGMYLQVGLGYSVVHVLGKEAYLDTMKMDLVWGGLPEIRAYSYLRPVLVFETPSAPRLFRDGAEQAVDWARLPPSLVYIAFYGNHYAALFRK